VPAGATTPSWLAARRSPSAHTGCVPRGARLRRGSDAGDVAMGERGDDGWSAAATHVECTSDGADTSCGSVGRALPHAPWQACGRRPCRQVCVPRRERGARISAPCGCRSRSSFRTPGTTCVRGASHRVIQLASSCVVLFNHAACALDDDETGESGRPGGRARARRRRPPGAGGWPPQAGATAGRWRSWAVPAGGQKSMWNLHTIPMVHSRGPGRPSLNRARRTRAGSPERYLT
jgi:hypothetical protein